jgi:hypothetical protein
LPVEPVIHVKEVEGTSIMEQLNAGAEKVGAGVQGGEGGGRKGAGTFKRSKVRREGKEEEKMGSGRFGCGTGVGEKRGFVDDEVGREGLEAKKGRVDDVQSSFMKVGQPKQSCENQ